MEIIPGIWLPTRVKHESYSVPSDRSKKSELSWRWIIQNENWADQMIANQAKAAVDLQEKLREMPPAEEVLREIGPEKFRHRAVWTMVATGVLGFVAAGVWFVLKKAKSKAHA